MGLINGVESRQCVTAHRARIMLNQCHKEEWQANKMWRRIDEKEKAYHCEPRDNAVFVEGMFAR